MSVRTWDYTLHLKVDEKFSPQDFDWLEHGKCVIEHATKCVFQLEAGEKTGAIHVQGRMRIKDKKSKKQMIELFDETLLQRAHWSITSNPGTKEMNYCLKYKTRLAGPWKENDIYSPPVLTWEVEDAISNGLRPWQRYVEDTCRKQMARSTYEPRRINCVIDRRGGIGKSTLVDYLGYHNMAVKVPFTTNARDISAFAFTRRHHAYLIDVPCAVNMKNKSGREFMSAIERLKDGEVTEWRYNPRSERIQRPCIWVFTNDYPDKTALVADRWSLWEVDYMYNIHPTSFPTEEKVQQIGLWDS